MITDDSSEYAMEWGPLFGTCELLVAVCGVALMCMHLIRMCVARRVRLATERVSRFKSGGDASPEMKEPLLVY